jgi:hypothetical protein
MGELTEVDNGVLGLCPTRIRESRHQALPGAVPRGLRQAIEGLSAGGCRDQKGMSGWIRKTNRLLTWYRNY